MLRIVQASAPGKLILCGEHAVVYGRPAIALPLPHVRAYVHIARGRPGSGILFHANDINRQWVADATSNEPLGELTFATLRYLSLPSLDLIITLTSTIPIAGGMGSGAAVATAIVRALASYANRKLTPDEISTLVYASEKRFHGTPSGIDNAVVAYEQPVWFEKYLGDSAEQMPQPNGQQATQQERATQTAIFPIAIAVPLTLVIGDTGVRSKTRLPVGDVRQRWLAAPAHYEALFDRVSALVQQIRDRLADGHVPLLGKLLDENQALLEEIGVSSPDLERLIGVARRAGAMGAKLSGAGWGGVMFALADGHTAPSIMQALREAGAAQVLQTTIGTNA